jgi:molybdopterin biosynthesis enzyme
VTKLAGEAVGARARTRVVLEEAVESDGRESYLRAVVDPSTNRARLTGHQGSGNLFSLVQANALLIIPAGVKSRPANAEVDAWLL